MSDIRDRTDEVVISPAALAAALGSEAPPVVLDVRWRLDRPDRRSDHASGHIPGAVYVDLDHDLADHGAPATEGRHPLPSTAHLQAAARSWGISEGDAVVVADDLNGMSAARAWWLLRAAGLADVRILDGGLSAWRAAGLPLEEGSVVPVPGDVVLTSGALPTVDLDEVAAFAASGMLIDARASERYRGDVEPIDPRAGHIPGAVNRPTTQNVVAGAGFKPAAELRAEFEALGVRTDVPTAVYCGSGVTAAHQIAALTIAGFDAALFPGSWSQWSNHPDRPVATGD
ncbi:sulfurtransferase [Microbacterium sp. SLBN-146]|uniref:sulfurtransferase n=1 Tax=Microbacterium sp. SLBN-146 TaxID=2768457 RepID=UPI001153BA09|nr:sulfurtransferase [Microbacterium sp. SLBN-146]TQJ30319.1 thiosulfate/3-mercaptopyruvate sulfurtransferase [Microbacterium sp. SLBN-146]